MRFTRTICIRLLAATFPLFLGVAAQADAKEGAIEATVTGNDQQVGFRAAVMKQAIKYNLAGSAKNEADEIVHFTLQGDKKRIDAALATIRKGTKRSSGINVATKPAAVDPALNSFTIVDWTSSSRNITNKYTLVFKRRTDDTVISKKDVKAEWHQILENTLAPEDRQKLRPDD
ncbi:acylphosphatase [Labrys sp. KB_33_2]|uniref:acylphosphatase n=1 Tax=Labrys sp. KB_33_2 TaxID=3237479 RepID=UPI003F93B60B